ncbi:SDR family NAD(P)-dependent oxidoreductase [Streptomyces sp. NPDC001255]|uniref:SDR family NAD(P)-dependent oxidoreductase n=1 Tax=Streptomyces sp. NPDC001255 TaxID=3364550 RepID=UPI0036AC835E
MSWTDKGVMITGAGSGIGRDTAVHLAALGARVVVSDLSEETGAGTVELIRAAGGTADFVACDVADEGSVEELLARTVELLGTLDHAVNNAGIADHPGELHELSAESWDRVVAVDLRGTFLCLRGELRAMLGAGHGTIVNIASNAGVKNAPGMAAYTSAKHGVVGLTKNAALQYARRGIRVNAVCPGTIATPGIASFPQELQDTWADMIPMGRMGTTADVAKATAYLLSEDSGFLTGVSLLVDGGLMYD